MAKLLFKKLLAFQYFGFIVLFGNYVITCSINFKLREYERENKPLLKGIGLLLQ